MTAKSILTACCLTFIGAGLYIIPDGVADNVRGIVQDLLRPGLKIVHATRNSIERQQASRETSGDSRVTRCSVADQVAELTESLAAERERNRMLQIRLAQLEERQIPERKIPQALAKSSRLILPSTIEVAILGDTVAEKWRSGKLLDHGAKNGLRENELVLSTRKSSKSLIDFGEDANISVEDTLLLGRCVIGKVEHVGRWTSSILLVTDAQYTGRAQLIRETDEGQFVFGEAQGILRGQGGSLCKLDGIPAESSVHVRDAVYTAERDGILPIPLYYGEVVEATLGPDDREWSVLVKPVSLPTRLTTAEVLRTSINPERLAVN